MMRNRGGICFLEPIADHQAGSREAVVRTVAKLGMGCMFHLTDKAPLFIEAIADSGIFVKEKPAAEAGSIFAWPIEIAIMHEATKAGIEKDLGADVEGPVEAGERHVGAIACADLPADMDAWSRQRIAPSGCGSAIEGIEKQRCRGKGAVLVEIAIRNRRGRAKAQFVERAVTGENGRREFDLPADEKETGQRHGVTSRLSLGLAGRYHLDVHAYEGRARTEAGLSCRRLTFKPFKPAIALLQLSLS